MKICIIDPNSFRNLGDYDKMLIENLKGESTLIGNINFNIKQRDLDFYHCLVIVIKNIYLNC